MVKRISLLKMLLLFNGDRKLRREIDTAALVPQIDGYVLTRVFTLLCIFLLTVLSLLL